jgi:hypothetical protein
VGHKRDERAGKLVTTANSSVEPTSSAANLEVAPIGVARPRVGYAFLRQQSSMEQVLAHLGLLSQLRGGGAHLLGQYDQEHLPMPPSGVRSSEQRTGSVGGRASPATL